MYEWKETDSELVCVCVCVPLGLWQDEMFLKVEKETR